jgi:hypothetical protein
MTLGGFYIDVTNVAIGVLIAVALISAVNVDLSKNPGKRNTILVICLLGAAILAGAAYLIQYGGK